MKSIPTHVLRNLHRGEQIAWVGPHETDLAATSTAARIGGKVKTQRAWIVPVRGQPMQCVVLKCIKEAKK